MALGRLADINLARTATVTLFSGVVSPDLPLANLQEDARYVAAPTRFLGSAGGIEAALATPRSIDLVAVLFHSLGLGAQYRLSIAGPGGSLAAPVLNTGWQPVFPAVYDQTALEYEASNWWTGQLASEDIDLYPPHLWIPLAAPLIASAVRLEFDDSASSVGYFDIGGLWLAQTFKPAFNFSRGRENALDSRDQLDESPSGRVFGEDRTPRRRVSVTWQRLSDGESDRLFDAGARVRTSRTVLFVPDIDDPKSNLREAFPATFDTPPSPKRTWTGLGQVAAVFKEIIA